jgi:hypothetical protein
MAATRKLNWRALHEAHPASHRVRLVIPRDEEGEPVVPLREVQTALSRLVSRLQPSGSYALAIDRAPGAPEVHCAFVEGRDADLFTEAVAGPSDEPASQQRLLTLTAHAYEEVVKRAGTPPRGSRGSWRHVSE